MKRQITPKMARRLFRLMEGCSSLESEGELRIFAPALTSGGPPIKGYLAEINLILRGHEPGAEFTCKLPELEEKP